MVTGVQTCALPISTFQDTLKKSFRVLDSLADRSRFARESVRRLKVIAILTRFNGKVFTCEATENRSFHLKKRPQRGPRNNSVFAMNDRIRLKILSAKVPFLEPVTG